MQQAYRLLLRDHVAPGLRAAGLKGSGANWTLHGPGGNRALIAVYASDGSTPSEVRFDARADIWSARVWEQLIRATSPHAPPAPARGYLPPVALHAPGDGRRDWRLRSFDDVPALGQEVVAAVVAWLPLLGELLHDERLADHLWAGMERVEAARDWTLRELAILLPADDPRRDPVAAELALRDAIRP